MTGETIMGLAERVQDVLENVAPDRATRVTMGEMADGSGRWYALVDTIGAELEQAFRVTTPAPLGAPEWATRAGRDWRTEVRIGDEWRALSVAGETFATVSALELDTDEDGFHLILETDDGERHDFNVQGVAYELMAGVLETISPWAHEGGIRR